MSEGSRRFARVRERVGYVLSMLVAAMVPSLAHAHPGHHEPGLWPALRHLFTSVDHLIAMIAALLVAALVVRLVGKQETTLLRSRWSVALAGLAIVIVGALLMWRAAQGT